MITYYSRKRQKDAQWERTTLETIKRDLRSHYPDRGVTAAIELIDIGRIARTTDHEYTASGRQENYRPNRFIGEVHPDCFRIWSRYHGEINDILRIRYGFRNEHLCDLNSRVDFRGAFEEGLNPYTAVEIALSGE